MKTGKFLVKANYIKPAKEEWVICDVRLLSDNIDNFLCIKSTSAGDIHFEDNRSLTGTEISLTSTLSQNTTMTMGSLANRPFTALCNLSEYRSCDIRTTTINCRGTFALKLVPNGILSQKRLLMATDDEEQLTSWLSILKGMVGRKKNRQQHLSEMNSPVPPSSTLGSVSSMGTLDRQSQNTFSFEDDDDDAGLTENDIYEPYSVGDYSQATIQDTPDARRLNLHGDVYLRTAPEDLEIAELTSRRVLQKFPYKFIRRFGSKNGVLRVEAGRRCTTGDGMFAFKTDHSPEISIFIREAARKLREQSRDSSLISSTSTLNASPSTPTPEEQGPTTFSRQRRGVSPVERKRNGKLGAVENGGGGRIKVVSPANQNQESIEISPNPYFAGYTSGSKRGVGKSQQRQEGPPTSVLSSTNGGSVVVTGEFVAKPGRAAVNNTVPEDEAELVDDNEECHYDNMSRETYGNLRCPVVPAPRFSSKVESSPDRCIQELDDVLRELGISGDDSVDL